MIRRLSLLAISLLASVFLAEFAVRTAGHKPLYVNTEQRSHWKYHPLLGWAHTPGQEREFSTPQFQISVRINQEGLRDQEHAYARTDASNRVLVLGDSFAWGFGVEEANRFSEVLEALLSVEVINAGVSGYSTDQELLWFEGEGVKYDVDLVLLVFCGNDDNHNQRYLVYDFYGKPWFALDEDRLVLNNVPVPEISTSRRLLRAARMQSSLVYYVSWRLGSDDAHSTAYVENDTARSSFGLTLRLLGEMRDVAHSRGATFMIVSTPAWWSNPSGKPYADFIDALRQEGFLTLDVEFVDGFDRSAMTIRDDGHWNAEGHRFVARQIEAFIEAHQLLGPQRSGRGLE